MFVQTTTTRTKVNSGCEIVPVGGYSNRDWCKVHESYSDYATGWCNRVMSNPTTTTHTYVQSRDRSELKFTPCAVCGRARRVGPHSGYRRATVGDLLLVVTNRRTDHGWGPVRWAIFYTNGPRIAEGSVYQGSEYQALVRQAMLDAERAAARVA